MMADLQFTTRVFLGSSDNREAELGNIRGRNLSLELRSIDCDRKNVSEKARSGF
jgi:hypothetical protein